jgi:heptosyltransferase-2
MPVKQDTPDRMLILSVAGIGDFILGTPALRAIRRRFPQAQLWMVTIPEAGPLAERCPHVDVVRNLDLRTARSALLWSLGGRRRDLRRLIRELREARFDIAMNLYQVATWAGGLRMAAFLWAVRPSLTVGRRSGGKGMGYDLASEEEGHEIEAQLAVARLIGATSADGLPELWVTEDDARACASLLERVGISVSDRVACLHTGSAQPEKRWPAQRFVAVGRRLAEAGARVLLIGTERERGLCASVAEAIPAAVPLAGETSLPVLAALLRRAALLVTNDSGPMHMAAALGVPLVVPFGPGTPGRFGPRGRAACLVFAAPGQPGGPPWWEAVPAEPVADAAVRLWAEVADLPGAPARSR